MARFWNERLPVMGLVGNPYTYTMQPRFLTKSKLVGQVLVDMFSEDESWLPKELVERLASDPEGDESNIPEADRILIDE